MKKIKIVGIVTLMALILINTAIALDNCKGIMFESEIPCLLLLPVNTSETACNTLTVSVYNNGSTLLYTQTMAQYNSFKCNSTFNQTSFGTYTFQYGTDDTGTIIVEEDEAQQYYLYVVALIIFFILLWIDYKVEEGIFTMIAGMLAMVIGINLFISGFPNLTNQFLRVSIALPFWGTGAYLILAPAMEFFENWRDKE